jgi:hypothetical protein
LILRHLLMQTWNFHLLNFYFDSPIDPRPIRFIAIQTFLFSY